MVRALRTKEDRTKELGWERVGTAGALLHHILMSACKIQYGGSQVCVGNVACMDLRNPIVGPGTFPGSGDESAAGPSLATEYSSHHFDTTSIYAQYSIGLALHVFDTAIWGKKYLM